MSCIRQSAFVALCLAAGSAQAQLHYRLALSGDARLLRLEMCSERPLSAGRLLSGSGSAAELLVDLHGDGQPSPTVGKRHIAHAALPAGGCVRYSVDAYAAALSDRYQLSWRKGDYLMLPIQRWLWRPERVPSGSTLSITLPAGWAASLPLQPLAAGSSTYRLPDTPAGWDGTTAFGRFIEHRIALPGGQLRVAVLPVGSADDQTRLLRWIEQTAPALLAASGRLPLPDAQVLVVPLADVATPVPWAQVSRASGSALKLFVGLDAEQQALLDDWTLVHELSHLLHPYLHTRGRWLSEGLASYYQNVLRARVGLLTADQAWSKLDAGFSRGRRERGAASATLAEAAVGGYRSTMRVYWGGAAFWLEAELALRQHSGTDLALLLDAFARRHLPADRRWEPERFVAELDRLAGVELLRPLFTRYANATVFPSLDATYRQLGLGAGIGSLALDDAAPAAAIRRAIMRGSEAAIGQPTEHRNSVRSPPAAPN